MQATIIKAMVVATTVATYPALQAVALSACSTLNQAALIVIDPKSGFATKYSEGIVDQMVKNISARSGCQVASATITGFSDPLLVVGNYSGSALIWAEQIKSELVERGIAEHLIAVTVEQDDQSDASSMPEAWSNRVEVTIMMRGPEIQSVPATGVEPR